VRIPIYAYTVNFLEFFQYLQSHVEYGINSDTLLPGGGMQ